MGLWILEDKRNKSPPGTALFSDDPNAAGKSLPVTMEPVRVH